MKKRLTALKNNNSLSLIADGKHYQFTDERADEVFEKAINYKADPTEENWKSLIEVIAKINVLVHNDLIVEDGQGRYYLKGLEGIEMPDILAKHIIEYAENDYPTESLVNFWKLLSVNPNPEAREGFYKYIQSHGLTITDKGYAVLYKAVETRKNIKEDDGLINFVSGEYMKIKKWKKAPSKYAVVKKGDSYELVDCYGSNPDPEDVEGSLGDLETLHEQLDELIDASDAHYVPYHKGGDYGNVIRLGTPVSMPREKCDPNIKHGCSVGLHVGARGYVKDFGWGASDRRVVLAILVNPMNIVALPEHDRSKIRVCEYYPYAVMSQGSGDAWEEIESGYFEEDYCDYEQEEIDALVANLGVSERYKEDNAQTTQERTSRLIELYG